MVFRFTRYVGDESEGMPVDIIRSLIVEDEPKSAAYFRKGLSEHGYVADLAQNGEDGH